MCPSTVCLGPVSEVDPAPYGGANLVTGRLFGHSIPVIAHHSSQNRAHIPSVPCPDGFLKQARLRRCGSGEGAWCWPHRPEEPMLGSSACLRRMFV